MGQQQWERRLECRGRLECRDAVGRPAEVVVTVREGQLAIVVPAGECAVFGPEQIAQLDQLRLLLARGITDLRLLRSWPWQLPLSGGGGQS